MTTRSIALGATLLLAGALALAPATATPATAHDELVSSTPSAGETLTELPGAFSITMNEAMLVVPGSRGFVLQIQDAAGRYYGDGCVEVVDASMSAHPALGEPGAYTMLWQSVSADGHSVAGTIPFTWAPTGDYEPSASSAEPPVCGQAATPTATPSPTPTTPTAEPTPEPTPASGIDLATVLWIGGGVLALGVAAAVTIALASRKP